MSDETKYPTLYVDAISLNKPDRPYATGYVLPDVLAKSVAYVPASVADAVRAADQKRIAALEAALRPMLRSWDGNEHVPFYGNGTAAQGIRDALSGGTSALEAHDAALIAEVRKKIAQEVESHAEDVDSMHWRQAHRIIAQRIVAGADVLATIRAKGGK